MKITSCQFVAYRLKYAHARVSARDRLLQNRESIAPFKEWLEALRYTNGRAKIRVRLDRARLGNLGDHLSSGSQKEKIEWHTLLNIKKT